MFYPGQRGMRGRGRLGGTQYIGLRPDPRLGLVRKMLAQKGRSKTSRVGLQSWLNRWQSYGRSIL